MALTTLDKHSRLERRRAPWSDRVFNSPKRAKPAKPAGARRRRDESIEIRRIQFVVAKHIEDGSLEPIPLAEDAALRTHHYPYRAEPPRKDEDPQRWMDADRPRILLEEARCAMALGPRIRRG